MRSHKMRRFWPMIGVCAAFSFANNAVVVAGSVDMPGFGGYFRVPVESLKEARFRNLVPQQYDFSCGSAATATLLSYHYDIAVSETDVFKKMFEVGDQGRIRQVGFSLLDMQSYLKTLGLRADGFRLTLDRLEKAAVPAIVLVNTFGYRHFIVLKGIMGDEVMLGDPALGMRVLSRAEFESIWDGIAFVIRDRVSLGRKNFNSQDDWSVRVKAPLGNSLSQTALSDFTVQLWRGANSF
ncbi:hypothetical protein GCM10007972_26040 [Iodidimonas muriae]|uniref:Peptidase C39 domain-containing protein n=1 Tax=Iodidimonas muriae TaxID=261467 RepID=A0ABQ2LGR7_9PROT|nr:C39 family peptidase [Iodidimonas muriae]GER08530.1 hypothetical protein JCM17843_28400 [Kordiimonadales bacterium JCM 17843]GGO16693.1 hypothetical protein GCM10007972_26040 [Iodidimonas muriae]